MKKVRFGVIGLGNMGSHHARQIAEARSRDMELAAVCDIVESKAKEHVQKHDVPWFTKDTELMDSGLCDAVIIATPHYWHAPQTIYAARAGLHVLCEKPLSSSVGPARAMIAECKKHEVALGVMLQQRTRKIMQKMKQMIDRGTIGEVFRVQLIASSWFRTQAYYDSGAWRGTWDGEGGGVLINQAPHSLDLFQMMAGGIPQRVVSVVGTRGHKMECEDTANVLLDYGDGKVSYIYATTAEEPGIEQLMVIGEKGTLVARDGKLRHAKLSMSVHEHIHKSAGQDVISNAFAKQKVQWKDVKLPKAKDGGHLEVTKTFAAHLVRGKELLATGAEAINELELSNAAYLSGYEGRPVELPVDADKMERLLNKLQRERSTGKGGGLRDEANRWYKRLTRSSAKGKAKKTARKKTGKKSAKKSARKSPKAAGTKKTTRAKKPKK